MSSYGHQMDTDPNDDLRPELKTSEAKRSKQKTPDDDFASQSSNNSGRSRGSRKERSHKSALPSDSRRVSKHPLQSPLPVAPDSVFVAAASAPHPLVPQFLAPPAGSTIQEVPGEAPGIPSQSFSQRIESENLDYEGDGGYISEPVSDLTEGDGPLAPEEMVQQVQAVITSVAPTTAAVVGTPTAPPAFG